MKNVLLFFVLCVDGVFGESVSVTEGDSVTLHTGLPEIQRDDVLQWRFGAEGSLLAQINRGANTSSIYNEAHNQRFRDRLKLDNQTGDLNITNIRTEHTGLYEVTNSRLTLNKIFNVTVRPVDAVKSVSVIVGDSVTLNTDLTEIQRDDVIQWRFEHLNSPIAEINRKTRKVSKHDGADGIFRHRLKLDYWTGSLTIMNITTNHSGLYKVDIGTSSSKHTIHKSFNVTVSGEVRTVSVMKGESVTLHTGLTEIQTEDFITWMFGDIILAEIYKKQSSSYEYDGADERFRDGLQLNNQTGSLTITQCKTSNSGLYELKINSNRHLRFTVTVRSELIKTVDDPGLSSGAIAGIVVGVLLVFAAVVAGVIYHCCKNSKKKHAVKSVSVMEGHDGTLNTDTELQTDDQILWTFGNENSLIAKIKRGDIYDGLDRRFRDRLKLDEKTGSLTITNTRTTDSGEYKLKIIRNKKTSFQRFNVTVFDLIRSVLVMENKSVTLNTDAELQTGDVIIWMFGEKDTVIAESKGGTRGTITDHGPDERFRGRLKLDHQTGSLNITNTTTEDSGAYKQQITRSGKKIMVKLFNVSVSDPTALGSIPEERPLLQPVPFFRQRSISSES